MPPVEGENPSPDAAYVRQPSEAARLAAEDHRIALSPVGIFEMDAEARLIYANPRWEAIVLRSVQESLGDGWREAVHPDDRAATFEALERSFCARRAWSEDVRLVTPEGIRWVHAHGQPVFTASGALAGYVGTVEDISEVKAAEDALRRAHARAEEAYARERRIAVEFQAALVPSEEPRVPGFTVGHAYRTALREADVGGDFYNILPIDRRRTALVIGDVGGKGLAAAVVAARTQQSVIALAANEDWLPGAVLEGVRRVVGTVDPDQLITLFLGILDGPTGRLQYASAGHGPALVLRARTGGIAQLETGGPAICSFTLGAYPTHEAFLHEDDLLLLYTDGLTDARAGRGMPLLGLAGVAETLARHREQDPSVVVTALCDAAMARSGGQLRDDIALVALRRCLGSVEGR